MIRPTAIHRFALLSAALLCAAPALADDTILRLAETATVMAIPDELTASLRAEVVAATAQDAQKRVNELMRGALEAAKVVTGVTVSTGPYNVWRIAAAPADRMERWQAGQSLNLSAKDGDGMLRLVGELQQLGLAENSLVWRLSRETERKTRQDATKQALAGLRGRADEAAEILGLRFESFREVRLDSVMPPPIMPRQQFTARAALAAAAPPPNAEAEEIPVTATADADVVLKPR